MERRLDCDVCRFTSAGAEAGLEQQFLYHQEPRLVVTRNAAERLAVRSLDWVVIVAMKWIFPPQHMPVREMIHSLFSSAGQAVPMPFMEAYANKILISVLRQMADATTVFPDDIAQEVADPSGARVLPQRLQWNLPPVGMVRLRATTHAVLVDEKADVIRQARLSGTRRASFRRLTENRGAKRLICPH